MRTSSGLALLLLSLLLPSVASAQNADSTGPLRTAVSATKPMTRVRVELRGGQRLSGILLTPDSTAMAIEDATGTRLRVPYADVTRYWDRRRALAAGAIVGGALGAGAGAFFAVILRAMCEYDCGGGGFAAAAVVGGLAVGAVGAVAGGVVGAAIPRWSQRWRASPDRAALPPGAPTEAAPAEPAPAAEARAPRRPREVGEVTFLAHAGLGGYAASSGIGDRGMMAGGSAALAFRVRRVTFGPEIGGFGGAQRLVSTQWVFRVDLADRHRAGPVPYAVAGAGTNTWDTTFDEVSYFTGVFGAGVTFGDRHQWRAEARWSPVLQHSTSGPHPMLLTVGAGRRFSW